MTADNLHPWTLGIAVFLPLCTSLSTASASVVASTLGFVCSICEMLIELEAGSR